MSGASAACVSRERLADGFDHLSAFTATPGAGITRLAFSSEDVRARAFVSDAMAKAGLTVRVDGVGNIIGRRDGTDASLPVVMTGSHLDSVRHGGNYDGPVGVLGAIEALRAMKLGGVTTRAAVEVVAFAAEESARFDQQGHRLGSRAMAGLIDPLIVNRLRDATGVTLAEALKNAGLDPEMVATAKRSSAEISSYVELHIEQGEQLVREAIPVGIVTAITGTTRLNVTVDGRADHSGGAPMKGRKDALAAAAEITLAVEAIARAADTSLVATVGTMEVAPGSISVVPGRVRLGIDIRDIVQRQQDAAVAAVVRFIYSICSQRGLKVSIDVSRNDPPISMSNRIQRLTERAAELAGVPAVRMPSHSGHDATSMWHITETGMIFTRNTSGRSHSELESVSIDDVKAGVCVLAETLVLLANRDV